MKKLSNHNPYLLISFLLGSVFWLSLLLPLFSPALHAAEQITYYHYDALGSPVAATDENGNLLWKETYEPYGKRLRKEDGGTNNNWYTGKQHDTSIGLSYFGGRWYDPSIGRFMAIDPAAINPENIYSVNRYAYVNNNPYKFVDPDGWEALEAQINAQIEQLRQNGGHSSSTKKLGDAAYILGNDIMPAAGDALGAPANLIPGGLMVGTIYRGGKLLNVTKRGVGGLLKAGRQLDRNGLTKAGRALQKHGDRSGSVFPKSTSNADARNQQGQDILKDILKSGNQTSKHNRFGCKDIFDNNTGRGVRFDADRNMKGFLEP